MKKSVKNIIKYNFKTLIGFEILYKLLSSIIFVPLFLEIFKLITKISGYSYLTLENIINFLLNPITIIFLVILIMVLTFYTLIDISTIIIILDSSYNEKKISIKEAFLTGVSKSFKLLNYRNILMAFLIIFLIPFLNIGISGSFISTIKIPEFISDFIFNNQTLTFLYTTLLIILTIILFRWLYVIHYFVLEDCHFKEARKKSINLSKKNKLKDFIKIIFTQIIIGILYLIFIFISIGLIVLLYKVFSKYNLFSNLSITIIWLVIIISFIIMLLLSTPISYAIISILFYKHKEEKKESIKHLKIKEKDILNKKKFNIFKYTVIVLVIICSTIFTYGVITKKYNLNIEYLRTMEVTAHRGASFNYPENTLSAFYGAKDLGADWIELDIQQTKDRKIIVSHDTNLKRTTGLNKNVYDLTYDEIKDLDAGSFFSTDFKDERIPLLEDVIKFAKDHNIKLNIEIKPSGKEVDFEKDIATLILDYDFIDNCVVTSQVYDVLENVKKANNNIKTVYVMSLAYGNLTTLEYADNFSIEASSITKTLVSKIHNEGKEIYAWTVNTASSINEMIDLNVDNIITDNITLAKETIYNSKTSNIIKEFIKRIENLLK